MGKTVLALIRLHHKVQLQLKALASIVAFKSYTYF